MAAPQADPATAAIVLRLTRLSDSSLIVHWLTRRHGLVKTVARGASRPSSPFRGQLDLFFGGEITFVRARRGDLHHLRELAVHAWREGLRHSYTNTLLAGYFCELSESALEPEHPEPEWHDLLQRGLDHLATQPATLRALTHFESESSRILGISHHSAPAAVTLADHLGRLPATRAELVGRLSTRQDFPSSDHGNGR